jgi:PAS domain S-box-containing protein
MKVSEKTVDTYWTRVRQKLDARNRTHAVAIAFKDAYQGKHDPLFGCDDMLAECQEGVWIIDMRGNTVYANQKLAEMFGYEFDQMQKLNGWDLLDEQGRAEARRMTVDFPTGPLDSFKFRFKTSNGSDLWVLISTSPIRDESGDQIRTLAMLNALPEEDQHP